MPTPHSPATSTSPAIPAALEGYDPMAPAVQQDPFPHYAALRREAPVFRHPKTGIYFVSRLDTVRAILADTGTFSSRMSNAATQSSTSGMREKLQKIAMEGIAPRDTLLTADPPRQTRYRKVVGPMISNRRMRELEQPIREIATDLLSRWPERGRVEVLSSFAIPFPVRSIARVLAAPPDREADIKRWSDDSVAPLGTRISDERRLEPMRGVDEMQNYWANELRERWLHPPADGPSDLLTELAQAEMDDVPGPDAEPGTKSERRRLDIEELLSILQQLMVAGNETTTKLLSEILKLLALHPEEWHRMRTEPERIPAIIEEGLRLASPNQGLFRQVRQDTELEGVAIPEGSTVWVMFGAANRDERFFPEPDRFDPDRPNLREHVAFGHGAHFCIGAPLARLDARVALEEIARRVESIALAPGAELIYEPSFILRGLEKLELEVVSA